jgi:hypothetical protein
MKNPYTGGLELRIKKRKIIDTANENSMISIFRN